MGNGFDRSEPDATHGAEPVSVGVPMARPVELPPASCGRDKPHPFLLPGIRRRVALADIGVLIVLLLAVELVVEALAGALIAVIVGVPVDTTGVEEELERIALMPVLAFRAFASMLVIAAIVRHRRQSASSVGVGGSGAVVNVMLGVAAMTVSYVLMFLWQLLVWFYWPELWEQMSENADRILALIPRMHPLTFGAVALVIGLYEELIFRGFLMPRLRRATGSWTLAVILSSALFTFLHWFDQTAAALAPIAILSLVFSLVTIWRRSVMPAVIGHFLFDWSQFIGLYVTAGDAWT